MRTYLEHLTTEELTARLATLEEMGKATAARVANGDRGRACGTAVVKGRHVTTYANETALNVQRNAWKQTRQELRSRGL